jgi:GT2 family glycosyltransferase
MPLATKKNKRVEKATPAEMLAPETQSALEEPPEPAPPRVTALIHSYNQAGALRRCLAALERSQDRETLEILVVDKGSQDESPTLDSEFPETTFLRLPRNFGNTKALNIGMRTAAGELILFLSPEVEVAPDTISALLARLEADADAVAACPVLTDEAGRPLEQFYRLPAPATGASLTPSPEPLGEAEYATFDALMVTKYFVRGLNYLDERYGEFGADAEMCYQIRRAQRKILAAPSVRVTCVRAPVERSTAARNLVEADRLLGLAKFFSKHYGFGAGLLFRLKAILGALFSLRFGLLSHLVTGQKIDGSQSVIL